jgi:hypothetical protein
VEENKTNRLRDEAFILPVVINTHLIKNFMKITKIGN